MAYAYGTPQKVRDYSQCSGSFGVGTYFRFALACSRLGAAGANDLVVTLKGPGHRLRDSNLVIEQSAWGAFATEFYPTYDFQPVWEQIKARQS